MRLQVTEVNSEERLQMFAFVLQVDLWLNLFCPQVLGILALTSHFSTVFSFFLSYSFFSRNIEWDI